MERLKSELQSKYDWTNSTAFNTVDTLRENALNNRNIASFLRVNGYYATESELIAIIRRLDVDADQKITFDEFIEGMRPQNPSLEESYGSSSSSVLRSPSKFEDSKKSFSSPSRTAYGFDRSPMRQSHFQDSAVSSSGFLQAPLTSSSLIPTSSP
jgi:hypothetical protein